MSKTVADSERLNGIIARIMANREPDAIKAAYRDWAENYNQDLDFFGYVAPQIGVELFHDALANPDGLIFDAGCGTGLCGQALAERGYRQIHGADFSPDMLEMARQTGHYQQLTEADFSNPLTIDDEVYVGCLSIGVYNTSIGDRFLSELVRVTKPEGVICMSCRFNYFEGDLAEQIATKEKGGTVSVLSQVTKPYMMGQGADAVYLVLRRH